MKKNLVTLALAAAIIAGLVALNQVRPDRLPADRYEASRAVAERLEEADVIEAQYEDEAADADASADSADQIAQNQGPSGETDEYVERYLFETTKGEWVLEVHPDWAPIGAARFREAVEAGVYNDTAIFRVIPGFVIQFGIPGDPAEANKWKQRMIMDEPVIKSNERGTITFAKSNRPNSRTTQLFINLGDNKNLDAMGFSAFGHLISGMDVVESINAEYGEAPNQGLIQSRGNEYLREQFPNLDYIKRVTRIEE